MLCCLTLSLTSCSTFCTQFEKPVEVKIPVPVACPSPPQFEELIDPVLKFDDTTPTTQKVMDIRASRVMWRDRAKQMELLLNSYRQKTQEEKTYFPNGIGNK